jgi:hypothetical protein
MVSYLMYKDAIKGCIIIVVNFVLSFMLIRFDGSIGLRMRHLSITLLATHRGLFFLFSLNHWCLRGVGGTLHCTCAAPFAAEEGCVGTDVERYPSLTNLFLIAKA